MPTVFIVNAGLASSLGSKGALNAKMARIAREGFQKAGWSVLETNREHFWSIRKSSSATSADLSTLATRLRRYAPCARYQA